MQRISKAYVRATFYQYAYPIISLADRASTFLHENRRVRMAETLGCARERGLIGEQVASTRDLLHLAQHIAGQACCRREFRRQREALKDLHMNFTDALHGMRPRYYLGRMRYPSEANVHETLRTAATLRQAMLAAVKAVQWEVPHLPRPQKEMAGRIVRTVELTIPRTPVTPHASNEQYVYRILIGSRKYVCG